MTKSGKLRVLFRYDELGFNLDMRIEIALIWA